MIRTLPSSRPRRFAVCLFAVMGGVAPVAVAQVQADETAPADVPAEASADAPTPVRLDARSPAMGPVADPFPEPLRRTAPHLRDNEHFTVDPVVDGVFIGGGFSFSFLLTRILGTGELRPQAPGESSRLLSIDRVAVNQTIDPNAGSRSDIGLYAAYGYAILDPILSGVRDGRRALLVDAIMYSEAVALTQAFTLATKIGVRRPRPIDYVKCAGANTGAAGCDDTDLQLSFFSGHASATGTVVGVATYLAFVRAPHTPRPWITLAVGTALTAFVSYERVRSGEHFPTDVVMGSLAGGAIGVLVAHFHHLPHFHERELEAPPLLVGYAPTANGGGAINLQYRF